MVRLSVEKIGPRYNVNVGLSFCEFVFRFYFSFKLCLIVLRVV